MMKVGELITFLSSLNAPDMEIMIEVTSTDGDHEVCDLQTAQVETRCDDVPCVYLHGDQSDSPPMANPE